MFFVFFSDLYEFVVYVLCMGLWRLVLVSLAGWLLGCVGVFCVWVLLGCCSVCVVYVVLVRSGVFLGIQLFCIYLPCFFSSRIRNLLVLYLASLHVRGWIALIGIENNDQSFILVLIGHVVMWRVAVNNCRISAESFVVCNARGARFLFFCCGVFFYEWLCSFVVMFVVGWVLWDLLGFCGWCGEWGVEVFVV